MDDYGMEEGAANLPPLPGLFEPEVTVREIEMLAQEGVYAIGPNPGSELLYSFADTWHEINALPERVRP